MAGLGVGLPAHSVVDAAPEWPSGVVAGGEVERPHEDRLELGWGPGVCADVDADASLSVADAERTVKAASGESNEE